MGIVNFDREEPLVSVYIPTRNRSELLSRAIESVLSQTYANVEVIVVNDGSTDSTAQMLDELQRDHHNICVIHNQHSRGACAARNQAIDAASGYFVTGLDDDDCFSHSRIAQFVDAYDDRYSFLCTTKTIVQAGRSQPELRPTGEVSFADMKRGNAVGNQIFIRRDRMDQDHRFTEDMPAWQDYECWFRLVRDYGSARILSNASYEMYLDAAHDRISDSPGAARGCCMFLEKHGHALDDRQRNAIQVSDWYNRRAAPRFMDGFRSMKDLGSTRKILALWLLTKAPGCYRMLVRVVGMSRQGLN